jgi:hypothetical protein
MEELEWRIRSHMSSMIKTGHFTAKHVTSANEKSYADESGVNQDISDVFGELNFMWQSQFIANEY